MTAKLNADFYPLLAVPAATEMTIREFRAHLYLRHRHIGENTGVLTLLKRHEQDHDERPQVHIHGKEPL